MKAQILKHTGLTEKQFYAKYKTQKDFDDSKEGKAFKKAQFGAYIGGDVNAAPKMVNFNDYYDNADKQITGSTDSERQKSAYDQAMLESNQSQSKDSGGGMDIGSIMGMFGGEAEYGTRIPRAAGGTNMNNWWSNITTTQQSTYPPNVSQTYGIGAQTMGQMKAPPAVQQTPPDTSNPNWMMKDTSGAPYANSQINKDYSGYQGSINDQPKKGVLDQLGALKPLLGPVGDIIGGIGALGDEEKAADVAKQQRMLSDLQLRASTTRPEMKERKYVRPEDVRNTGEEFFPIYGVGTNVLARNGVRLEGGGMIGGNPTEIQNTYGNGNSMYDDLGYVPLIDDDQQKTYYYGGGIPKAKGGWSNYLNTIGGGGSGFSGAGASGSTPWGAIGSVGSGLANSAMGGGNARGNLGGTVGGLAGAAFGPAGMAIGQTLGTLAGNALDPYAKSIEADNAATKRNTQNIGMNQMAPAIQAGYASHMRDGGYMNPEYNPQVITMFGDHNAQDFADYAHKDQYRAGGHLQSYTPPSERAMETYRNGGGIKSYGLGGELETHWGGGAETMSHNPYLPGTGETVMFRGKSHEERSPNGETGIGVTYGGNPVEVERGEPMVELEEGGELDPQTGEPSKSGVVFGNLKIPNQYIDLLGDKSAKGKKFKNYVADLSKTEAKQNKVVEKATKELDGFTPLTSFDKLKLTALQANIQGANMKLKDIADKKINAAHLQNAINDTAEENGLVADDLARGIVKIDKEAMQTREARWGDTVNKAKDGITTTKETTIIPKKSKAQLDAEGYKKGADGRYRLKKTSVKKPDTETKSATAMDSIPAQKLDKATGFAGGVTKEKFEQFKKKFANYPDIDKLDPKDPKSLTKFKTWYNNESEKIGSKARILDDPKTNKNPQGLPIFGDQYLSSTLDSAKKVEQAPEEELIAEEDIPDNTVPKKPRFPWEIPANALLNYLRPTDQSELDYNQLMGEMYAMSNNQVDPVQAQLYNPELAVPYDISLQDQLNANQADYNAAQRMTGYNPAAQANLNAQKYMANSKVLGDQFRANQAMKAGVYDQNRNTLNQAKLTNLGILDKQYERQSAAVSNTKATTQAALNSISDKYAKNKLENRKLGIYENMYNYRFGQNGRAKNYNGLQFFDTQASAGKGGDEIPEGYKVTGYDANRNPKLSRITEKDMQEDEAALEAVGGIKDKNGGSHKKNYKNSSVVRAYKNL